MNNTNTNTNTLYDYIIIGGGIAGLYANYKLSSKLNGLLLERNDFFGGRAQEIQFHGSLIKLGAGIMTTHNHLILNLLKKLKLTTHTFSSFTDTYNMEPFNMGSAICDVVAKYTQKKKIAKKLKLTMREFLIKYFSQNFVNQFILNCEYHDFVDSDVEYFIEYYDINDMSHEKSNLIAVSWNDLANKLVKKNCLKNVNVLTTNLDKQTNIFTVKTDDKIYSTKKIIFATSLKPLVKLSKNIVDINFNDYLGAVPFIRIYCYYKNGFKSDLTHFTIVKNKLQKVVHINDNILMASYSDGNNALYWKKVNKLSKGEQIKIVSKCLEEVSVKGEIDDIVIAFWDEGIHYYKPTDDLDKTINLLSNPAPNVHIIGEMVSYKQGWVEGCIESVNRTLIH